MFYNQHNFFYILILKNFVDLKNVKLSEIKNVNCDPAPPNYY